MSETALRVATDRDRGAYTTASGRHDQQPRPPGTRPRVVIVGAGFGGLVAARALRKVAAKVTVIDRRNYHLFQPLLYQVATAGLSPADIAAPIRGILRDQANAEVLHGPRHRRRPRPPRGHDRRQRPPHPLRLPDHRRRRPPRLFRPRRMGSRWPPASRRSKTPPPSATASSSPSRRPRASTDPEERRRLLTFVIVGGGPTGVEMAGAIAELAKMTLVKDFRTIDPASARVILVEGGPRVLLAFPEDLSAKARRSLEKLGVEVLTNTPVELCDAGGVVSGGKRIEARTILWAAGVQAAPAAKWLQADKDRAGRVKVNPDLIVPGDPDIFVIGDNATVMQANGQPVPGVAPAAKQMGEYVARVIAGRIAGKPVSAPFRYRNYGNLATIGRHAAVADFGWLRLSGYPGLAAVGRRPHLLPDRLPQPARGDARLAVGLRHLPARRAADHRRRQRQLDRQLAPHGRMVRRLVGAARLAIDARRPGADRRPAATAADDRCASPRRAASGRPGSPRRCSRRGSGCSARKASV